MKEELVTTTGKSFPVLLNSRPLKKNRIYVNFDDVLICPIECHGREVRILSNLIYVIESFTPNLRINFILTEDLKLGDLVTCSLHNSEICNHIYV